MRADPSLRGRLKLELTESAISDDTARLQRMLATCREAGVLTSLDDFGAHDHDSIGYHYHAHTVTNHKAEVMTGSSTVHVLMKGAYIGKIGSIPYFRTSSSFKDNKYLGGQ